MRLEVTLITGRSLAQGTAREAEKTKPEYVKAAAICELDPADLKKLGVDDGAPVRVRTEYGSVVVYATASTQAPHLGIAFIPLGPWANQVIRSDTDKIGTPSFKGVHAEIEPAQGETVEDAVKLLSKTIKGK